MPDEPQTSSCRGSSSTRYVSGEPGLYGQPGSSSSAGSRAKTSSMLETKTVPSVAVTGGIGMVMTQSTPDSAVAIWSSADRSDAPSAANRWTRLVPASAEPVVRTTRPRASNEADGGRAGDDDREPGLESVRTNGGQPRCDDGRPARVEEVSLP